MASTAKPCKAKTKKGEPCAGFAVGSGDYCFVHDPTRAAERAAARRKGGRARHGRTVGTTQPSASVAIDSVADILKLLEETAGDLRSLENSVARGRAMIALAAAATRTLEVSELEERLSALEQQLNERH